MMLFYVMMYAFWWLCASYSLGNSPYYNLVYVFLVIGVCIAFVTCYNYCKFVWPGRKKKFILLTPITFQ